jgi:hypothetical protein
VVLRILVGQLGEGGVTMRILTIGDRVQDTIGHWYEILEVQSPYRFRVRLLLTTIDGQLYDPGYRSVVMGRSELRLGE